MSDDDIWAPKQAPPPSRDPLADQLATPPLVTGYHDFVLVARGGDSLVYRARDDALDRDVAVKVVLLDDPESIARFRRELEITVRLGRAHPNILTVLATGTTTAGQPCLVTDYVELGSLQHRLAEHGPLPSSEVTAAGIVVADALAFAHGQGVLHRDVKPQNVLVLPTSYLLADFGLARAIDAEHTSSLERFSYRHASPQVLDGAPPSVADDLYSLGSTLFTLLDGRPPFAAADPDEDSALSYLRRARTEPPRPIPDTVPGELAEVVRRCLARAPEDRYDDAEQVRRALAGGVADARAWAPRETGVPVVAPGTQTEPDRPPAATIDDAPATPAVSALAHLERDRAPRANDAEPTGLRPDLATGTTPPIDFSTSVSSTGGPPTAPDLRAGGHRADPAAPSRRRWPLLAALAVAALTVGLVFGLRTGETADPQGGRSGQSTTPTSDRTSVSSVEVVPTASLGSVPPTTTVQLDPSIKPRITTMRRRGDSLNLVWTDPSKGRLPFIVFHADPDDTTAAISTVAGVRRVTLARFPAGRRCLVVSTVDTGTTGTPVYGRGPARCVSS